MLSANRICHLINLDRSPQRQASAARWLLVEASGMPACVEKENAIDMGTTNHREWWLLWEKDLDGCNR